MGTSLRSAVALLTLVVGYLLVALVAGAPGSPLVPVLPAGVGVPGWTARGARLLSLDRLGTPGLTALALATLACLLAAFGVLSWEAWRGRVRLGAVLVGVGCTLAVATAAPLMLSRDVNAYVAYGRIFAVHGSNPYVTPPSAFPADPFARAAPSPWRGTTSLYGPAFILTSGGIARVFEGSPAAAVAAFKVMAGAGVALGVLLVVKAARMVRPGREAAAAVVLGLNPVVVVHTVGGGHNEGLIVALFAGALVLAVTGDEQGTLSARALAVTVLLALSALVKSVLVIPLLLWVWALARRSTAGRAGRVAGAHLGVAAGVAVALFAPFLEGLRSLRSLTTLASVEGWASGPGLVARGARELGDALGGADLGDALSWAVTAVFLGVVVVLVWRLGRGRRSMPAVWGAALLLFALGAPYLAPWYAAWFLPFLSLGDTRLALIGLGASGLLALTGVPAEPGTDPALYDGIRLGVHYVAAPIMLAFFAVAARRAWRWSDDPLYTPGSSDGAMAT